MSSDGPDRGTAWAMAFAGCFINLVMSGMSRMSGILFVALIDAYGANRQQATTPFIVRNAIRCLSGPFVGILGQHYSVRGITAFGGVIATVAASMCCLAPDMLWITLLWGGLNGIGIAFSSTLFMVILNQYFEKHRATAMGIASSGGCIGAFVFPVMLEFLLKDYGVQGSFLILGGVTMHVIPVGIMLRKPSWIKKTKTNIESNIPPDPKEPRSESESASRSRRTSSIKEIKNISLQRFSVSETFVGSASLPDESDIYHDINNSDSASINNKNKDSSMTIDINPSLPIVSVQKPTHRNPFLQHMVNIIKMHQNPMFHLISLALTAYVVSFNALVTLIVDYGKDKGLEEYQGKYVITALSCGDLIGRLCLGWITDKGYLSLHTFMLFSLCSQGTAIVFFPLTADVYSVVSLSFVYGVVQGCVLVMLPVMVVKYMVTDQKMAMGCVGILSGITSFATPPLIGYFRDEIGSYDGLFYLLGGVCIVFGLLWLLEPMFMKRQKKNEEVHHTNRTAHHK